MAKESQGTDNLDIKGFTPSESSPNGQHPHMAGALSSTQEPDFDLDRLRLPQDFSSAIGAKKLLTTVPVRKPHRQEFVRVHPEESWRIQSAVLELKEDRETYFVEQSLWADLGNEIVPKILFTTITRQGVVFLWPIRLPGSDGRLDAWNQSALMAAEHAMKHWIRLGADRSLGAYEVWQAPGQLDDPTWPELTFSELMQIAVRDRWIASYDHPVLRRLRGEL
jgi:hypothetical protein